MLNVVAIMGRLARDPEMRQTTTGKNVASFRIACDRGRRDAAACVPLALQIRRALKSKRRCYKNGKVRNHADYQRRSR